MKEKGEDQAFAAVSAMQRGLVVDLDNTLALEAAALGWVEKLALADSVILATARKHQVTLWTQDAHFEGKAGVKFMAKSKA